MASNRFVPIARLGAKLSAKSTDTINKNIKAGYDDASKMPVENPRALANLAQGYISMGEKDKAYGVAQLINERLVQHKFEFDKLEEA